MEELQKVFQSEAFGVKAHQQLIKQKKKINTFTGKYIISTQTPTKVPTRII